MGGGGHHHLLIDCFWLGFSVCIYFGFTLDLLRDNSGSALVNPMLTLSRPKKLTQGLVGVYFQLGWVWWYFIIKFPVYIFTLCVIIYIIYFKNIWMQINPYWLGTAKACLQPYFQFCYFRQVYRKLKYVFNLFNNNYLSGKIQL